MSGHSKWSTIKRKKGVKDVERSKIFSKLSRIITLSVKEGGGIPDPEKNATLRFAVERARAANMPKENITRAIERATSKEANILSTVRYEGFAPGGSAMMIVGATDNSNRTYAEVRHLVDISGGKLGASGSAAHLFERVVQLIWNSGQVNSDQVLVIADQLGAKDIEEIDDQFVMFIPFEATGLVENLDTEEKPDELEVVYKPLSWVKVDEETFVRIGDLVEKLEEHDDIDRVFTNASTL